MCHFWTKCKKKLERKIISARYRSHIRHNVVGILYFCTQHFLADWIMWISHEASVFDIRHITPRYLMFTCHHIMHIYERSNQFDTENCLYHIFERSGETENRQRKTEADRQTDRTESLFKHSISNWHYITKYHWLRSSGKPSPDSCH